jgi:hypothetical protein
MAMTMKLITVLSGRAILLVSAGLAGHHPRWIGSDGPTIARQESR